MEYLKVWRSSLPDSFQLFGMLFEQDKSLSIPYGVVATALLWCVRNDSSSSHLTDVLTTISGTQDVSPLLDVLTRIEHLEPLASARTLSSEARSNDLLLGQLNRLLEFFRDDWLQYQLLKPAPPNITVSGSVEGANIVIGGVQYIVGDLIISHTVVPQKVRPCPTAPNPPPHFAGRRSELEQLKQNLSADKSVAITGVQGMGGIGKTALALQLAAEMKEFGAVLWASLGPEPTAISHLLSWARHGDPDFEPGENSLDVIASRVQAVLTDLIRERCNGRVLVILDDVWEGNSVAAARLLVKAAPSNSVYLITTRSQLVAAQLRSNRLELKPMSAQDALLMLRNLLSSYPIIPDEPLLELAAVVGYHPLAIELVAGQVNLLERPESEIGDLVSQYRGGIPAGSPFRDIHLELGESREDNLELVLSFSYASLDPLYQARFLALGALAYAAPFDQAICQAIWQAEPKPSLDALRHRALLGISDSPGWYQQHPLLRAYARALLNSNSSYHLAVMEKYTEYIVRVTEQFVMLPLSSWDQLEPYVPHVEEVGSSLVASTRDDLENQKLHGHKLQRGLSFALNTSRLLSHRREINHVEWLEMGLLISQLRKDLRYEVFFLNEVGEDFNFRGDTPQAIQKWHMALKVAEAANDKISLAQTHLKIGTFYLLTDLDLVTKYVRAALKIYEELQDPIGLANALLLLGDWRVSGFHPYDERGEGIVVLQQALTTAQSAGYELGVAEAKLKLGRLFDTLADRGEAIQLLSEAIKDFQKLRQRDREGVAHIFLASAFANTERFEEANSQLEKALPLLKSTGDQVGQAVALRNLGELYAYQERVDAGLVKFVEALPLVRKQTMRWLNEDSNEISVAAQFFSSQLESVHQIEHAEQFRARLTSKEIASSLGATALSEETEYSGFIPDDMLKLLLTTTIAANTLRPDLHDGWSVALQDAINCITKLDKRFTQELEFIRALLDITNGRASDIPESNFYVSYVQIIGARIALRQRSPNIPLLADNQIKELLNNTLVARIFQPDKQREWGIQLRKLHRNACLWGDDYERDFYAALQAALNGRLAILGGENPYHPAFEVLLHEIATYEILPIDSLLENTAAVKSIRPDNSDAWLEYLGSLQRGAARRGERNEFAFIEALICLVQDTPVQLPSGNPYQQHLQRVSEAVTLATPLVVPLPPASLASIMQSLIVAKTTEPKTIDVLAGSLTDARDQAHYQGRFEDVVLFDALLDLIRDEEFHVPQNSIYEPILSSIVNEINNGTLQPSAQTTIPQTQIDAMSQRVIEARTQAVESVPQIREQLQAYRLLLDKRGDDWEQEREFVDTLTALLEGQEHKLSSMNPYAPAVEKVYEEIHRHTIISSKGGRFSPRQLDALLKQTAHHAQAAMDYVGEMWNDPEPWDAERVANMFQDHRMTDMVAEQTQWKETLFETRERLASEGDDWKQEIDLLNALIAVTGRQPVSLPPDNAYYSAFQAMLEEMKYSSSGMSDNIYMAALALKPEEYQEYFSSQFSGRNEILEKLDIVLVNTVSAKTIFPDRVDEWITSLERNYQRLVSQSEGYHAKDIENEMELLRALQAVLRDEDPTLPDEHPYQIYLKQIIESIHLFHGLSDSPNNLTADQIRQLYFVIPGLLTFAPEDFDSWKASLEEFRESLVEQSAVWEKVIAFIDAILIVMERRPADLPLTNPYRPYLLLIQYQIRQLQ